MFKPHDLGLADRSGTDGGKDSQCIRRVSVHGVCRRLPGTEHDTSQLIPCALYCNEDQAISFLD